MKHLLAGVATAAFALSLATADSVPAAEDAKALFEEKCSICHSIERPSSKRKDRDGWTRTVIRMKNRNGAPITDEQAQAIIDYLTENFGKQ